VRGKKGGNLDAQTKKNNKGKGSAHARPSCRQIRGKGKKGGRGGGPQGRNSQGKINKGREHRPENSKEPYSTQKEGTSTSIKGKNTGHRPTYEKTTMKKGKKVEKVTVW